MPKILRPGEKVTRRRITVHNIPAPIREALQKDFRKRHGRVSINDLVQRILVKRYRVELKTGGGTPKGTDCDPLILKVPDELHAEIRRHAAKVGCSMRVLVIDALAREYDLTEWSPPLVRERSYQA